MEIREAQDGEVLVLSPDGSLASGEDCRALESKLAAVLKQGVRFVVVDCAGVPQLASPAIRALLMASRKLGRAQGRVVLCGMNAKVGKAFALSGFDRDFTVVGTCGEAVRAALRPLEAGAARSKTTPAASKSARRGPAVDEARVAEAPGAARAAEAPASSEAPPSQPQEPAAAVAAPPPAVDASGPAGPDLPAIAAALSEALGVNAAPWAAAPGPGEVALPDPEAVADRVLAALDAHPA